LRRSRRGEAILRSDGAGRMRSRIVSLAYLVVGGGNRVLAPLLRARQHPQAPPLSAAGDRSVAAAARRHQPPHQVIPTSAGTALRQAGGAPPPLTGLSGRGWSRTCAWGCAPTAPVALEPRRRARADRPPARTVLGPADRRTAPRKTLVLALIPVRSSPDPVLRSSYVKSESYGRRASRRPEG
jgi:hypothetical protein